MFNTKKKIHAYQDYVTVSQEGGQDKEIQSMPSHNIEVASLHDLTAEEIKDFSTDAVLSDILDKDSKRRVKEKLANDLMMKYDNKKKKVETEISRILESEYTKNMPILESGVYSDILVKAMSLVDYNRVAREIVNSVKK